MLYFHAFKHVAHRVTVAAAQKYDAVCLQTVVGRPEVAPVERFLQPRFEERDALAQVEVQPPDDLLHHRVADPLQRLHTFVPHVVDVFIPELGKRILQVDRHLG